MEEALYYNALALRAGGDRETLSKLRRPFTNWESACKAVTTPSYPTIAAEWQKLERAGVRLILREDADYPLLLAEIADPPFGIYVMGKLPAADTLAIVGTRGASPDGKNIACRFARELARSGFAIVSGLAFGIDAAAHEGCLEAGGQTVAVLAGGLHDIYPRENARLAGKILANGGAIISEYPMGAPPYASRFLERNRIISGLSRGVLIVEAPIGSGSLATARRALDQNRDVFVVPGPIAHRNFHGSHSLIRQGAELVADPREIMEAYGLGREEKISVASRTASKEEMLILKALGAADMPMDVDKIAAITKLEPRITNQLLAFLVTKDLVKDESGGYTI